MNLRRGFFFAALIAAAAFTVLNFGPRGLAQTAEGIVTEGVSYDDILIGKSTERHVIEAYGEDYKLIEHNSYSFEMIYRKLGLSFYYCKRDPDKEIFVIEIEPPARVVTANGIILGESTVDEAEDIIKLYDLRGIEFFDAEEDSGEDDEDARTVRTATPEPSVDGAPKVDSERNKAFIIDGEEDSDTSTRTAVTRDESEDSDDSEDSEDSVELDEIDQVAEKPSNDKSRRIVKRIEVFEKDGLRQCDSRFPRK